MALSSSVDERSEFCSHGYSKPSIQFLGATNMTLEHHEHHERFEIGVYYVEHSMSTPVFIKQEPRGTFPDRKSLQMINVRELADEW